MFQLDVCKNKNEGSPSVSLFKNINEKQISRNCLHNYRTLGNTGWKEINVYATPDRRFSYLWKRRIDRNAYFWNTVWTISFVNLLQPVFPPRQRHCSCLLDPATLQLLNSVQPGNFKLSLINHIYMYVFNSFWFSSSSKLPPSCRNKRFCEQLKRFLICNVKIYHGCTLFPVHPGDFKLSFINYIC